MLSLIKMSGYALVAAAALSASAALAEDFGILPVQEIYLADGTEILAHSSGLSFYTFDVDAPGTSNCYQRCAEVWPPVLLSDAEAATVQAPFGVTQRTTNLKQLTLNEKPLYLFYLDRKGGDILGDGVGGVWHLVPAP